jgi:hypothetical protein
MVGILLHGLTHITDNVNDDRHWILTKFHAALSNAP